MDPYLQVDLYKCAQCGRLLNPVLYYEVRDTTKEAAEALKRLKEEATKCDDEYPHKCPFCGNAAYVGARKVDCKAKCKDSR